MTKTGGGTAPPEPSILSQWIKALCPQEFIQMVNEYDDDSKQAADKLSCVDFLNSQGFATVASDMKR